MITFNPFSRPLTRPAMHEPSQAPIIALMPSLAPSRTLSRAFSRAFSRTSPLALLLVLILPPSLAGAASGLGQTHALGGGPLPDSVHVGAGAVNELVGAHIEISNPVGSIWVLVGRHLNVSGETGFEQGRATGAIAGVRFFSGGRGLESSWYAGAMGGTMEVDTRDGEAGREAYQRLGFGLSLGYQYLLDRLRLSGGLGAAYLEPYTTADDQRIDREFVPMAEATIGLQF